MKNYIKTLNNFFEKAALNYIDKVTRTLYPKQKPIEATYKENEDDDDPILFI